MDNMVPIKDRLFQQRVSLFSMSLQMVIAIALMLACAGTLLGGSVIAGELLSQEEMLAGQEEFVPISELPPEDRLPAAPLLIAAYSFVWMALLIYLWSIWRRLTKLEKELKDFTRTVSLRKAEPDG